MVVITKFYLIIIKTNNESNVAEANAEAIHVQIAVPDPGSAPGISYHHSLEKLQTG